MNRANRPIQNRIGDGRKIAPVINELKVEQFTEGRRIALSPSRIAIQSEFKPP